MGSRWWSGFRVGVGVALLIFGIATMITEALLMANGEAEETKLIFAPVETVTCQCDDGHEFESVTCGITFDFYGASYGPYCQVHIGELLEDFFPKAWAVEDDDGE